MTHWRGTEPTADDSQTDYDNYGDYGEPNVWSGPRFRYTGQIMLPEAQLYHYKARVDDPVLGRFLQTDPVGTKDDLNLYAYTHGDPVNESDATGEDGAFFFYSSAATLATTAFVQPETSPVLGPASVGLTGLSILDTKITKGHMDWKEIFLTGLLYYR